eukprot:5478285-Pyramimonas_sp.AAC.1
MWTPPLGLSVDFPKGPRSAVLDGGGACGQRHWGLWLSSLWGHEALCCGRDACGQRQWCLRWSSSLGPRDAE